MSPAPADRPIGTSPPRFDGEAKCRGSTRYVDDLAIDGLWHAATVRSPHPRARILSIDPRAALCAGPVAILTADDLPGPNVLRVIEDDWPVLAEREVRHCFEPVAIVAAATREAAREAASLVEVRYAELDATLSLADALERGADELASCEVRRGDAETALARAARSVDAVYETGHQEQAYLEPQGVVAIPRADGALEIAGSLQCPYYVHKALVHCLGVAPDKLRVRQLPTGGGFGGKEDYPDMLAAHAALLARATGHPVKLVYDRTEDMRATTKRHPSRTRVRAGASAGGKLCALDIDICLDGGAFVTLSPVVLSRAVLHGAGPYACDDVRVRGRVLRTNTVPNGAFRGFGAPQAQFAIERALDELARECALDPYEIRERNAYRAGDTTPTGQVLDESTSALACLREAETRSGFRARWRANEEARAGGPVRCGIGLSLFWHGSGFTGNGERLMRSPVVLRLAEDGMLEVRVAATDFGQGTETALAQIVAEHAKAPLERVRVVAPDTAEVPDSGPTVASRTIFVVGGVLARAAERLARELGAAELGFDEASRRRLAAEGPLEVRERYEPPAGEGFDEERYEGTAYSAYGYGAGVVEVEVDADTLETRVTKATLVADVGRAIHPVLCAGQVEGGTLQSLGWALSEDVGMHEGAPRADRFQTYILPTSLDAPTFETALLEHPSPASPTGAKGVGELPADGGAPALVAAIENATGIGLRSLPATPERLLDAGGERV